MRGPRDAEKWGRDEGGEEMNGHCAVQREEELDGNFRSSTGEEQNPRYQPDKMTGQLSD